MSDEIHAPAALLAGGGGESPGTKYKGQADQELVFIKWRTARSLPVPEIERRASGLFLLHLQL
jgi:hypothetical protein